MLCFIIPFKSRAVSLDWTRDCLLLKQTLNSAWRQTDPDYQVIVVHHEKPITANSYDSRVSFLAVDYPSPEIRAHLSNAEVGRSDKWKKITRGFLKAQEYCPDFVMVVDADDLIHRELARHANARKTANGWVFKSGYRYHYGGHWLVHTGCFHQICGTSIIVRNELVGCDGISGDSNGALMREQLGHMRAEKYFSSRGTPLDDLPFPGAIYVLGHSGNQSQNTTDPNRREHRLWRRLSPAELLRALLRTRIQLLTASLREQFSMERPCQPSQSENKS
jgi:hypothetical protein